MTKEKAQSINRARAKMDYARANLNKAIGQAELLNELRRTLPECYEVLSARLQENKKLLQACLSAHRWAQTEFINSGGLQVP